MTGEVSAQAAMKAWTEGSAKTVSVGGVQVRVQRPGPEGKRIVREARSRHTALSATLAKTSGKGAVIDGDAAVQLMDEGLAVVGSAIKQCIVWPELDDAECEYLAQLSFEEGNDLPMIVGRFCGIVPTVRGVQTYFANDSAAIDAAMDAGKIDPLD